MKLNFVMNQMTALRYFIPLVIEGNRRGITSNIFILPCGKYNCPGRFKEQLSELSEKYGFKTLPMEEVPNHSGLLFFIESAGLKNVICDNYRKVVLTYMINYSLEYKRYIDRVDHVIFPSEFMESAYEQPLLQKGKHLCLGSPKYDISFDVNTIYKKFKIRNPSVKKAFVIMPRTRDSSHINFKLLYETLHELGYEIITKTRGKDHYSEEYYGDYHFTDSCWYPHDSMDLIHISDLVINFGSTAIKECVKLKTPIVNFDIKPFKDCLQIMCNHEYCENLNGKFTGEELKEAVRRLNSKSLDSEFNESIEKYLFSGNSSKRILDFLSL